jgi:hypothetical protein
LYIFGENLQGISIFHSFTLPPTLMQSPLNIKTGKQRCKITSFINMMQKCQKVAGFWEWKRMDKDVIFAASYERVVLSEFLTSL